MKQGQYKTIKIDGITDKGFKLVLNCGKEKYNIWKKEFEKETDSEAFKQYKEANIGVGSEVEIEYSEKEKSFIGEKGDKVNYIDRSIWRFMGMAEDMNSNGTYKPGKHPGLDQEAPF